MKKKLSLLLMSGIMAASLASCGGDAKAYNDLCKEALDSIPMLLDASTGKEIYATDEALEASNYRQFLGLNVLTWRDVEFKLDWKVSDESKWIVSSYKLDATRTRFMPNYTDNEETGNFECGLTLTISALKGGKVAGKASESWKFQAEPLEYSTYTIQGLEEAYTADPDHMGNKKVAVVGRIVGSFEQSTKHLYSGVYVQDGAYGVMLYAGTLGNAWFEQEMKVGDPVIIAGATSPFNGLLEVKPDYIEVLTEDDPRVTALTAPVVNDGDEIGFENLVPYQSALVRMTGLKYKSGKVTSLTSHTNIIFTKDSKDVTVRLNYHLGETKMQELKDLIDTFVANTTVVDFFGVTGVYNDPQLSPVCGREEATFTVHEAA